MPINLRQTVLRLPLWAVVACITGFSVVVSVAAMVLMVGATARGFTSEFPVYLAITVAIPLLVATPVGFVITRLLHEVDAARAQAIELAYRDPLTGLLNRRRFAELAQRELDLARRSGVPLSVALLDIDDFKRVNDEHGHAVGDAALQAVARAFSEALRSTDLAARWGGEEFALVLPATDQAHAAEVLQRALAAIRRLHVSGAGGQVVCCTASAGVAQSAERSASLDDILSRADVAMYRAKMAGKDRVVADNGPG
jgi:diguanylate cyclase (GGDEF)-like protein